MRMNTVQTECIHFIHNTLTVDERPLKDVLVVKSGELPLHKSSGRRSLLAGGFLACIVVVGYYTRRTNARTNGYKMAGRDLDA